MRKRLSLAACALVLTLGLSGCVSKEPVEYDQASLEQSCESVFAIVQSGSISGEDITSMSEWNQGYLMAQFESQTGVQMEASSLVTALEGWIAAEEECGTYESHGDYTIEASSTGVTATAEAQFSERSADIVFTFDENMVLDSLNVGAHYSGGEIMEKAGLNTLLGMGTVFCVLIFMSLIISLIKYIPAMLDKSAKQAKAETAAPAAPKAAPAPAVVPAAQEDDTELIAVIAAAIAAAEGTSPDGFVVRSIKRRKSNKWNA